MVNPPNEPAPTSQAGAAEKPGAGQKLPPQQSPGELLAAGRNARELTIDEVGDALNLAPQTVRLLEADDFGALPAAAFTQGYIRNYAKLVGLDADLVVQAYQDKAGKPAVAWESPRTAAGLTDLVQRYPGVLITAGVAAVVLLIVIVLAVVWPDDEAEVVVADPLGIEQEADDAADASAASASRTTASTRPTAESVQGRSVPAETGSTRFDTPATSAGGGREIDRDAIDPNDPLAHLPLAKTYPADSVSPSANNTTTETSISGSSLAGRGSGVAENPAAGASPADDNYRLTVNRRLTPAGDDQVRVEVSEDCWVAIRAADGRTLFGMLARPGQTLNLTGAGPFRVKLGYTPGVELFFNDSPVLLEPYTRNDVASLVIGQ